MRICIPGGSGFIGRYFHEQLTAKGHEVVILDLVKPEWDIGRSPFFHGDIRDPAIVQRAIRGCDRVLNLAAAHHDFGISEKTFFDVNENGARVLCEAMDKEGVREVGFFSTVAVFGSAPEPHTEDAPKQPESNYGKSKLAAEKVYEPWVRKGEGRRALIIRPTVTFGPRNYANMYSLIRQVNSGKFVLVGDGENIKSLSYVENIVDATIYLWMRDAVGGQREAWGVYHFVDKPDLKSREISEQVYRSLGKNPPKFRIPLGLACLLALPFDIVIKLTGKNLPVSSARIKKLFAMQTKFEAQKVLDAGFKSRIPLAGPDGAIDRMVKWYLAEGQHKKAVWHLPPEQVQKFSDAEAGATAAPAGGGARSAVSAA
ncbi:MAG: NAD(P)-dependent oxidoreductase [Phycisphaerae bacterium]|nr:NAD(P)-dependent oxidoreductase [Phycisphaerae bacterium]